MYEFVEHTADIQLRVRSPVLAGVFLDALQGMNVFLFGENAPHGEVADRKEVSLEARDTTDLLVAWLSRCLWLSATERVAVVCRTLTEVTPTTLHGTVELVRAHPREEIKGVTYHNLEVAHTPAGYEACVTFDI